MCPSINDCNFCGVRCQSMKVTPLDVYRGQQVGLYYPVHRPDTWVLPGRKLDYGKLDEMVGKGLFYRALPLLYNVAGS
ncbi:MAG: hypothetical protein N2204_04620 [Anaerolineae bacterium]|nr:hypothetical protein [Anaerolineae bacterium]